MDQREGLTMATQFVAEVVQWMRCHADELRHFGASGHAEAVEACATHVEEAWIEWSAENLTVAEAAAESGYSEPHIRRLLRECRIKDIGVCGSAAHPSP
jgi:hypothetical protein